MIWLSTPITSALKFEILQSGSSTYTLRLIFHYFPSSFFEWMTLLDSHKTSAFWWQILTGKKTSTMTSNYSGIMREVV